jgi:hypothetical protein
VVALQEAQSSNGRPQQDRHCVTSAQTRKTEAHPSGTGGSFQIKPFP